MLKTIGKQPEYNSVMASWNNSNTIANIDYEAIIHSWGYSEGISKIDFEDKNNILSFLHNGIPTICPAEAQESYKLRINTATKIEQYLLGELESSSDNDFIIENGIEPNGRKNDVFFISQAKRSYGGDSTFLTETMEKTLQGEKKTLPQNNSNNTATPLNKIIFE